jgi:beta-N-acetylhexosaminidase
VQRFRAPFTALPAASQLYQAWCSSQKKGRALAEQTGWLMSAELRSVGVDFSYAPVLDLDYGVSEVIGDRSFGPEVEPIVDLAGALFKGLQYGSLPAVGKHFPGHGYVVADSHLELPRDERPLAEMMGRDIEVFKRCFALGIHAVMTAHVVYAEVDELPATFSPIWLRQILRQQLGFAGCIFSDDLSMKATSHLGDSLTRCEQAASAGCDSILICNDRSSVVSVLDQGQFEGRGGLLNQWLGKQCAIPDWKALKASADYQNRRAQLERWMDSLSVSG